MTTLRCLVPWVSLLLIVACGGDGKTTDTAGSTSSGSADDTNSTTGVTTGSAEATASSTAGTSADPTTGLAETSNTSLVTGETSTADTGTTDDTATGDPEGACREDADCDQNMFEFCFSPDDSNCGACQIPDIECFGPNDCDMGSACVPFEASCACDPSAMQCVQLVVCTVDLDCPDGQFCDDMVCAPRTCDMQQFDCPLHFDCVPDSDADDHCVRHPCEDDGECDGGFCVEGRCFDTLGACMPPAP